MKTPGTKPGYFMVRTSNMEGASGLPALPQHQVCGGAAGLSP